MTAPLHGGTVVRMGDNVKLGQVITGDNNWRELLDLPIGTVLVDADGYALQLQPGRFAGSVFTLVYAGSSDEMWWHEESNALTGGWPRTPLRLVWAMPMRIWVPDETQ